MKKIDFVISGDFVLTMNKNLEVIKNGAVAVSGDSIVDVGSSEHILENYTADTIIGGSDKAVLPGLVNTHCHAPMVYFRGLADDLPLRDWLEKHIWPAENRWLSHEFVYDATELACLEMLQAGITVYNDMYFYGDSAAEASRSLGIRAIIGAGIIDFPTVAGKTADDYLDNARRFVVKWKGDPLVQPCIAPHAAHTCSPDTLRKAKTLANLLDVPLHMHLSETRWEVNEILSRYREKPVKHLDALGILDERLIAAHCVHVDDEEIEVLAKRKIGVSHCVESNLKLASGIAPVPKMLKSGVRVTFGTDGSASNNDLNILSEMSTAAKLHKAVAEDPTVLDSKTAVLMATRWGAEALGLGNQIGSIEKCKAADIIVIDLKKPHSTPLYDIYSHMVYAVKSSDVETVMINGRLLIQKGKHTAGRDDAILQKAREWQVRIIGSNSHH